MKILVLTTESGEASFNDLDMARQLAHGPVAVARFDVGRSYLRHGMQETQRRVARQIAEEGIDVLVYPLGIEFDFWPAFFRGLPKVYRVLSVADDEHYFDVSHRYYAQCFDLVLTTNPLCERYQLYGVEAVFAPVAYDSRIYCPASHTQKAFDVSFVGDMSGKVGRAEYAEALVKAGIMLHAYGVGTKAGVVTREESVEIYRKSRINLNFSGSSLSTPLDAHLSINRRTRQLKGRCSMVALCGSFLLSESVPGIQKLFDCQHEIDVFDDADELIEKIRFYLGHEAEREDRAARAYRRAVRDYDEAAAGRRLVNELQTRIERAGKRHCALPVYVDREFRSRFGAWRWKYLVIFALTGRLGPFVRELLILFRIGRCDAHAALHFAAYGLHQAARSSMLAAALLRWVRAVRNVVRRGSRREGAADR